MPKYIAAYEQIPIMTDDELKFFVSKETIKTIEEENPGLKLDESQPLPMEDALNECIKDNHYANAEAAEDLDGYESGEISNESEGSEGSLESETEEQEEKGDGTKTRKRFRRQVQNQRRKALMFERPEIRQYLEKETWVPKKMGTGWWLKNGCWLCERCSHLNVGSNKFCHGCDLEAPAQSDKERKFFSAPNWMELSRRDGKQYEANGGQPVEQPKEQPDVRGVPLVGTREFGKEEGLFGGDFCWDPRAVHPYVLAARNRKVKSVGHFKELITKQGFTEMPDMDKFDGVNAKLGSRCKERIIRCMQARAREQLEGKTKTGYLQKWRRNYSQSGWWCDHCDYFTFFPAQVRLNNDSHYSKLLQKNLK